MTFSVEFCIMTSLPFKSWQQEEVGFMEIFASFFVSVGAGIACYYVCKWLDRHGKGK